MAVVGKDGELGLLPSRRGARLPNERPTDPLRVLIAPDPLRDAGQKATERFVADDQVANAVLAAPRKGDQTMVVVPIRDSRRQLQIGMDCGETPSHEALRTHVPREGRQSLEELTLAVAALKPVAAMGEEV